MPITLVNGKIQGANAIRVPLGSLVLQLNTDATPTNGSLTSTFLEEPIAFTGTSGTLTNLPDGIFPLMLFENGVLLEEGVGEDYTVTGQTITLLFTPPSNAIFIAVYSYTVPSTDTTGLISGQIPIVFQFDANGDLIQPCQIYSNAELNPQNTLGLGTYYLVTIYDQHGASLFSPMGWQFTQPNGATVDIGTMTALNLAKGVNIMYYPAPVYANSDNVFTGINLFNGAVGGDVQTVPYSATPVFDAGNGGRFEITLTGAATPSVINAVAGQFLFFKVIQDAVGGRSFTWPGNFIGGVTIDASTPANAICSQLFMFDGTNAIATGPGAIN